MQRRNACAILNSVWNTICAGEWGTNGVWDEPYDEASARETVQKLAAHWHRQDLRNGGHSPILAAIAGEQAAAAGRDADSKELSPQSQENVGAQAKGAATAINTVCAHKACSAKVRMLMPAFAL